MYAVYAQSRDVVVPCMSFVGIRMVMMFATRSSLMRPLPYRVQVLALANSHVPQQWDLAR